MKRETIFLFFLWIGHSIRYTDGACEVNFVKIGCFFDDMDKPRPVPKLLFSDRDASSGHSIGWNKWDSYLDDVTCRCAKKAAERRFVYFSLQFYGECWSGENAVGSFPRAGKSEHCVSKGFEKCVGRSKKNCVGESRSNFVYMISSHDTMCRHKGIGCFNNNYEEPRPFPDLLFSDRIHSPKYSNVTLDFNKWNTYIFDLACRCAAATRKHKYKRFSLQGFGECWTGPNLEPAVFMSEEEGICLGQGFRQCSKNDRVCVGKDKSNYVFSIA